MWVFVGEDENGEPITLFEIDKSAGKDVPMRVLEQFKGIVGSDSAGCWNHVGTMPPKMPAPLLQGHVPHDRR